MATVTLTSLHLHVPDKTNTSGNINGTSLTLLNPAQQEKLIEGSLTAYQFKGRSKPVFYGTSIFTSTMSGDRIIFQSDRATYNRLIQIWESRAIVCARDQYGNKIFGRIARLPAREDQTKFSVAFEIKETPYTEAI